MSFTVPLIGLLYAVTLAENRFPITVPGQTVSSYWIAGIVGALLFYLSDTLIAWNGFVKPFRNANLAIMVTYHLGQIGLVLALV